MRGQFVQRGKDELKVGLPRGVNWCKSSGYFVQRG